ncbi:MAG: FecR family protein [Flavisolibacter sp.]|jgi:ferric-dicitrate binding protein FerR (iron transport regulator)|nr:FecR family protein [Flavisolibacter sp.]
MQYEQFKAEDFVMEESFQQYCKGETNEAVAFWSKWKKENPAQSAEIEKAENILSLLNGGHHSKAFLEHSEKFNQLVLNRKGFGEKAIITSFAGHRSHRKRFFTYMAAAIILGLMLTGAFFYFNSGKNPVESVTKTEVPTVVPDILPGGDNAILTLADGTRIELNTVTDGRLKLEDGSNIRKEGAELLYDGSTLQSEVVVFNSISTPKGGQYKIILSDGTKIWLNAASSLHYPTSFPGSSRIVELTGEGYFEVATNASKPFMVKVNGIEVEVLGTHFNINSYDDEPVLKTTLLEGSVSIRKNEHSIVMKKGEQVAFSNTSLSVQSAKRPPSVTLLDETELSQAIAWKDGVFDFNNDHITHIMRQLSRWYNVDVKYKGRVPEKHYTGTIRKSVPISEVIKMIEIAGGTGISIDQRTINIQEK